MRKIKNIIKKNTKKIDLSPDEKREMMTRLIDHMDSTPFSGSISPWKDDSNLKIFNLVGNLSRNSMLLPVALAIVLFFGGTLTLASQKSLPGDRMYSIKRASESVDLMFAFTSSAKARINAVQAIRRLEEAEILLAHSKLDIDTKTKLEDSFIASSGSALKNIAEISSGDNTAGTKVMTEFRGNLAAHKEILQSIIISSDDDSLNRLPHEVQVAMSALNTPYATTIDVESETSDSAIQAKAEAKEKISDVQKYISANMTGEDKSRALGTLIVAQAAFENGDQAIEADSFKDAIVLFRKASDQAIQAKAVLQSFNNVKKYIPNLPQKVQKKEEKRDDPIEVPLPQVPSIAASTTATTTATSTKETTTTSTSTEAFATSTGNN